MRLATRPNGTPDGELVVVSPGLDACVPVPHIARTLLYAIENWSQTEGRLCEEYANLKSGKLKGEKFDPLAMMAPLPRTWQWLDGSAFPVHGELMQKAFNLSPIESDYPLMYQGMSDTFLSPGQDTFFNNEGDGIDFEGEFGVITDFVPMGCSVEEARSHIKLIIQINDWSLRTIAPREMKTGFGWVQAKPACSVAPVALSPDELESAWSNCRVCLALEIELDGTAFGRANGQEMAYGFDELIAHAAKTRNLAAGTIVGSGTVSNAAYSEVGSSCISEKRAIEIMEFGEIRTPFLSDGNSVSMEAFAENGDGLFGPIRQTVRTTS